MKKQAVLAIDSGTTGNRVIAFSKEGRQIAKSYYEFTQIFPRPGWVEHNPHEILETAQKALRDVLNVVGAENVASIGVTNQRETTILWDKNTGEPVHNAIVWQDRRTESICEALKGHRKPLKKKTGLFLDPYFSATKIKWLMDHVPGLKDRIGKGDILFGTPETWILWNLTGKKNHFTEPSNASRTLLLDLKSLSFDPVLLKIFSIPESILPEVKPSDSEFGRTDKKITGREIPVVGMLGDQQAALFAHSGWEKGTVKATYGTGIFVLANTRKSLCESESLVTSVAWKTGNEVDYALEGSIFMGGAAIQWLRDNLKILQEASQTEAIAAGLEDNEGVYFVPAFQGLGAPYWDPNARVLLVGLSRKATTQNIVRAVVESLAYQVRDVLEAMTQDFREEMEILRVDGGACANNFLMQFQSDMLQFPIERPKMIETTALGAAAISAITTGFWTRETFAEIRECDRIFHPTMDKQKADAFYGKWKEAVRRSLKWA